MPIGMLLIAPGMGREQYDRINEKVFGARQWAPREAPEGLIMHSAGPIEGGWYAYDIWESREDFERFANERLMAAMHQVIGGPPPGDGPQFFEIANLVRV